MDFPLEIVFRNMDHSDAIEARVREKVLRLERFFDRITRCRVVVQAPHQHHRHGKLYQVVIEIDVPGKRIMVDHAGPANPTHEDLYVAMRDAFSAATRQLEDHSRTTRGKVKTHDVAPHGRVTRISPDQDHGYVQTADGQEVYFNRNSVPDSAFDQLEVGTEVRIAIAPQELGEEARAQYVRPVGKHHLVDR